MGCDLDMPTKARSSNKGSANVVVTACPVERAIHVIGGKWKLLLLRSLLLNGPQGYNDLLASVAGISSKELTRNLSELSASGLVERHQGEVARIAQYFLYQSRERSHAHLQKSTDLGAESFARR
jgi:DNA-binding HxlR family transcriptional regulator